MGKKSKLVYKPDSVMNGHSSGSIVTDALVRPTQNRGREQRHGFCLALLQMGFAMPSLLPKTRCALTAPFHPYPRPPTYWRARRRCIFCCTFHHLAASGRYPAFCSMESGLSSRKFLCRRPFGQLAKAYYNGIAKFNVCTGSIHTALG